MGAVMHVVTLQQLRLVLPATALCTLGCILGCQTTLTRDVLDRPSIDYQIAGLGPADAAPDDRNVVYVRPVHGRFALLRLAALHDSVQDLGPPPADLPLTRPLLLGWASSAATPAGLDAASDPPRSVYITYRDGRPGAIYDKEVYSAVLGQPAPESPDVVAVAIGELLPHSNAFASVERILLLPTTVPTPKGEQTANTVRAAVSTPIAMGFDAFFAVLGLGGELGGGIGWLLLPLPEGLLGVSSSSSFEPVRDHWIRPTSGTRSVQSRS